MRSTIRNALHLVGREYRLRWIALAVLALVASGFEVVGAALVYVLIGLVADPSGDVELPLLGDVREVVRPADETGFLLAVIAAMAGFFFLRGLVQVGVKYVQQRVAHNAGARLSNRLVDGYLRWPYAVHLQRTSYELIRNANQAVKQLVGRVFIPMIRVGAELVLIIGMVVLLIAIAPAATGLVVAVVGGAAIVLLLIVQPRFKLLGKTAHQLSRDTLSILHQSLHGIRDVKILGKERYFAREYGRRRVQFARASYLASTLKELPVVVIEFALLGFILAYFAVVVMIGGEPASALTVLGLFAYAGFRILPSLQKVISGINELKFSAAPLEDLDADLRAVEALGAPDDGTVQSLPFSDGIQLRDVSFRYQSASRAALNGVNLTIRRGEQIGICGPTGGGKTTLVDLISGLIPPTAGSVEVDGTSIVGLERAWQRNLGVVPQMVFLIDDSLRRNIALGVPDERVDEDALQRAIYLAQLDGFIASLRDGLETTVGERGVRISGGQRQRIAIARALYRDPEVLVFDEGTSALDNVTEAALMKAVDRLRGDHTIILVAHRLSTVRNCDRVVFIQDGRVAGLGRYDQLLAENALFRDLAGLG